jgi:hypothetical protein
MVHFPPLPSPAYVFSGRYSGMSQSGFPHSEIPGSKPACGSPRLIAACHVLHRLLAPRHSPYALSSLTKCSLHLTFLAFQPEGRIATNMWSKNYRLQNIQLSKNRLPDVLGKSCLPRQCRDKCVGGEYRDRTGDLLVANQALSQLS